MPVPNLSIRNSIYIIKFNKIINQAIIKRRNF